RFADRVRATAPHSSQCRALSQFGEENPFLERRLMIRFHCSTCGTPYSVDEKRAGQLGKCSRCGKTTRVPTVSEKGPRRPLSDNLKIPLVILSVLVPIAIFALVVAWNPWMSSPLTVRANIRRNLEREGFQAVSVEYADGLGMFFV